MQSKQKKEINGKTCWQCSKCKVWCSADMYYHDKRSANGLKAQCKSCHTESSVRTRDKINTRRIGRESMRRRRITDQEKYRIRDRDASKKRSKTPASIARVKLNNAVRCGKVVKPSRCERCGCRHKLTAHHEDYSKPLLVNWLCYECHGVLSWKS